MNYVFSPSLNQFYTPQQKQYYVDAGAWPDDIVEVSNEIFNEYSVNPPAGKVRGVIDKMPSWVDIPPPSHDELVDAAEQRKQALINEAMQSMRVIQLKLQAGRKLTTAETEKLNSTLDYIDAVTAIDTATAPDIKWPERPVA